MSVPGAVHAVGRVAAWMFSDMRNELRTVLDDRLIASARMVAGIVHQFRPARELPQDWSPMLNVIARDGVACEVSLVRGEVQPVRPESALPQVLAKTEGSPVFPQSMPLGFDHHQGASPGAPMCWRTTACASPRPTASMCARA